MIRVMEGVTHAGHLTGLQVGFVDSDSGDLYLRTIAIEWLGVIASRIKVGWNRVAGAHGSYTPEWLYQLNNNIPVHVSQKDMDIGNALLT